MNRYVILCDCGNPAQRPTFHGLDHGRHVVAIINDGRAQGRGVDVGQNPPEDSSVTVKPNRRGDRRSSFNFQCAGCRVSIPRIRLSTVTTVLDRIAADPAELVAELARLHWTIVTEFYEYDVPETAEDDELWREMLFTEMGSQERYVGPQPKMVRAYSQRNVIPWSLFNRYVSRLPKDGRRR